MASRAQFEARLVTVNDEDDPLAVYIQYVDWILATYDTDDPNSGLISVLKRATNEFKGDSTYKADPRYLKLWTLYAHQLNDVAGAITVFSSLLKAGIGSSLSLLYEEYANILEAAGRPEDAYAVYRSGIKRQARPTERLKSRFAEFQQRTGIHGTTNSSSSQSGSGSGSGSSKRRTASTSGSASYGSDAAARYAVMMAPPQPGKRPEKFMFDLSLLYTEENGEYCYQEARARSSGLLGKTWARLPIDAAAPVPTVRISQSQSTSSERSGVSTLDSSKSRARKSFRSGAAEPTVTINTKEALADVFGMYNSPEKTMRVKPGSKHAPVKNVEPVQSLATPAPPSEDETTPKQRLRTEEKFSAKKENQQSAKKFAPYVDPQNATPFATPKIVPYSDPTPNLKSSVHKAKPPTDLSKVFTPVQAKIPPLAPLRDVFTDDHGKPQAKQKNPMMHGHERAKSHQEFLSPSPLDATPVTPFKVFSRPGEVGEMNSAPTPTPMMNSGVPTPHSIGKSVFQPFRDDLVSAKTPEPVARSWNQPPVEPEPEDEDFVEEEPRQEPERYDDDFDEDSPEEYEVPIPDSDDGYLHQQQLSSAYRDPPLGGRFGQFTVMTPITERTFEYTSTRSAFNTPSDDHLRRVSEVEDEDLPQGRMLLPDDDEDDDDHSTWEAGHDGRPIPPPFGKPDQATFLEDMTGSLSLKDALAVSTSFRPSNPCNPFDPPILMTLLARLTSDAHYHDLRHDQAQLLEGLDRFAKRNRKNSGNSTRGSGIFDNASTHPLVLNGRKFLVSGKLGEGGFGSVFMASDLGLKDDDEDTDDEIDEDDASFVAIKVVKPRNIWEYHVLRRLHSALPSPLRSSLILPHALYAFQDESFLVMELCPQGPLLDVVNKAGTAGIGQQGACLDELLVMFFTIELLRVIEAMHTIGFIHGDLKIDNCLLRLDDVPGGQANWSGQYDPSGKGGWSHKGLKIIDFGRTIDTRLFPPGQYFVAEWTTSEQDCPEIRENRPWTYETDYFGLAGIVYCMLFGKYIQPNCIATQISPTGEPRYKIATPFKRYWQTELWNSLFDILLNPTQVRRDGRLPVSHELGMARKDMEAWLQANCNRTSNTLKGLLKKVELCCL